MTMDVHMEGLSLSLEGFNDSEEQVAKVYIR